MLDFIFELLILLLQKAVDAHEKYIRSHSCYTGFFLLLVSSQFKSTTVFITTL